MVNKVKEQIQTKEITMGDTKDMKCFIITPIGGDNSDVRRNTQGVINSVLRPLLKEKYNFSDVVGAHEINASGSINNQLMSRIIYDDLVIANLTGLNPNVMYEVAVRHATMKPIIHICEKDGTILPFDIIDQRTIFYKNDMLGVEELKKSLELMIETSLETKEFKDNPIYNATKDKVFKETVEKSGDSFEKYLLERFDKLEERITNASLGRKETAYDSIAKFPFLTIEISLSELAIMDKQEVEKQIREKLSTNCGGKLMVSRIEWYESNSVDLMVNLIDNTNALRKKIRTCLMELEFIKEVVLINV
jgi:hypothetical protein